MEQLHATCVSGDGNRADTTSQVFRGTSRFLGNVEESYPGTISEILQIALILLD